MAKTEPAPVAPKIKIPKTLGACADRLYHIDHVLMPALKRQVEALEAETTALEDHIIAELPVSESGRAGKIGRVKVELHTVPTVKDWKAFYAHIKKTGAWELLQKRLSTTAVRERWDAKKVVPGVDRFNRKVVKVLKA